MKGSGGWVEEELLETLYLIVEEFRAGSIDDATFIARTSSIADRYGRHAGKEQTAKNQMPLFSA